MKKFYLPLLISSLVIFNQIKVMPITKAMANNTKTAFACGRKIKDVEGNKYNTVKIGSQCWMKENLKVGTKINGGQEQANNNIIEKYCYNNKPANCKKYGGLYQWAETVQYINGATNATNWTTPPMGNVRGICPKGWHLPTAMETDILAQYVDDNHRCEAYAQEPDFPCFTAESKLKSTAWDGTNNYRFSILPSGLRSPNGLFSHTGSEAHLWLAFSNYFPDATESFDIPFMSYGQAFAFMFGENDIDRHHGFSVRCLKD